MTADQLLKRLMQIDAIIVLFAIPCAMMPFSWMDTVHRDWLGLGSLPDSPITRYMARSLSLVYAMHGIIVLAITLEWSRYRSLVPLFAWLHMCLGVGLFLTDLDAKLPLWITYVEGPGLLAFGAVKLFLYRRATSVSASVQ